MRCAALLHCAVLYRTTLNYYELVVPPYYNFLGAPYLARALRPAMEISSSLGGLGGLV